MREAEVNWLLYKSFMPFPYVPTYDIDILVHPTDRIRIQSFLDSKNIPYKEEEEDKFNIRLDDLYPISIHFGAGWEGINYVSTETLWANFRNVEWHGRSVSIPSYEVELLSHTAHIFFELSFIRLSDILYLSELMKKKINWDKIIFETDRNNWKDAFSLIIDLVERINPKTKAVGQLPYPIPYLQTVKILSRILADDYKKKDLNLNKLKEYFREAIRYAFWRIGARILGRAPFGEILGA